MNVLVVDDNENNRYTLKSLLEEHSDGIIVHLSSSGEDALRKVLSNDIDIILLDIQMPVMDGFEVATLIQKNPKTRDIPIIFLTAVFKKEEFVNRGYEVGAVDYMTKPIEDFQLLNKIDLYVKLYTQKKELKNINKNLEEKIKEGVAKLREKDKILIQQSKMASMGEMIGIIAHQWKQPLNTMGLVVQNLELAAEGGSINQEFIQKTVFKLTKQLDYMNQTIDDFRSFFDPKKQKSKIYLKKCVEDSLNILASQIDGNNIKVEIFGDCVEIDGYENELKQVFLSIISNAKDALVESDMIDKKIQIQISKDDKNSIVSICNNAGAIPQEIMQNIFKPYFTTKGKKGTGLGLYMSKMIICDSMHGDIFAENHENEVCFKVVLPL